MNGKIIKNFVGVRSGFTLAEILITVGIIGVVAALTIPNLIKDYQKQQAVEKAKKAYTSLAQVVKQSEIDNGNNSTWDLGTAGDSNSIRQSFDTLWTPYLKVLKYCTTYNECGYKANSFYTLQHVTAFAVVSANDRTAVLLSDGTVLMVRNSSGACYIFADINGGNEPNTFGKDVFFFILDSQKGLVPYGYDQTIGTVNSNCSASANGVYCTAKIINDGWQMKDDYPW